MATSDSGGEQVGLELNSWGGQRGARGKKEKETPLSLLTEGSVPLLVALAHQNSHSIHKGTSLSLGRGSAMCGAVANLEGSCEPNSAAVEICFLDPFKEWPWVLDCSSRLPIWGTLSHQS